MIKQGPHSGIAAQVLMGGDRRIVFGTLSSNRWFKTTGT